MTANEKLKSELLTTTINRLKRWVTFNIVFTDKVKVEISNTGNDTVDDVSILFNKTGKLLFLTLHYKDEDTTKSGDHFRFHSENYGLFTEWIGDTWVETLSVEQTDKGLLIAHHALLQLVNVFQEIKEYCDKGNYGDFDPSSSVFKYDLVADDDKFNILF